MMPASHGPTLRAENRSLRAAPHRPATTQRLPRGSTLAAALAEPRAAAAPGSSRAKADKQQRTTAAIALLRPRGRLAQEHISRCEAEVQRAHGAVLRIQRSWRALRRRLLIRRAAYLRAVLPIQKMVRGLLGRRFAVWFRWSRQCAALTVQRLWRGQLGRKSTGRFAAVRAAALLLQCVWRGALARRESRRRRDFNRRSAAAAVLQRWARGATARRMLAALRRSRRVGAIFESKACLRKIEHAARTRQPSGSPPQRFRSVSPSPSPPRPSANTPGARMIEEQRAGGSLRSSGSLRQLRSDSLLRLGQHSPAMSRSGSQQRLGLGQHSPAMSRSGSQQRLARSDSARSLARDMQKCDSHRSRCDSHRSHCDSHRSSGPSPAAVPTVARGESFLPSAGVALAHGAVLPVFPRGAGHWPSSRTSCMGSASFPDAGRIILIQRVWRGCAWRSRNPSLCCSRKSCMENIALQRQILAKVRAQSEALPSIKFDWHSLHLDLKVSGGSGGQPLRRPPRGGA